MINRRLLLVLTLFSGYVEAANVVCTVVVRSEPHSILIKPAETPYDITKIDFDNGFRFAGQVLKEPNKLKTYTYFDSKDRYVLIHTSDESLEDKRCGSRFAENTLYSPRLENELSYQCQLRCDSP